MRRFSRAIKPTISKDHDMRSTVKLTGIALAFLGLVSGAAYASCDKLPSQAELKAALDASGATNQVLNGGFGLNMWGTIVNRDGIVCAVAFTGSDRDDQWPGSRVISAAKAYSANAYSLAGYALSTANLYASGQPGGGLWGLQFSQPTATGASSDAYKGPAKDWGQPNDPMVGKRIGGQIVFGGGFALYNASGKVVGGLGVSGDTACKDHAFGWRVRHALALDFVPNGPNGSSDPSRPDNIIYDMGLASQGGITSASGFGHVQCAAGEETISNSLPAVPAKP
jgi:uncharacterized protein GlcG (DUF336 family)